MNRPSREEAGARREYWDRVARGYRRRLFLGWWAASFLKGLWILGLAAAVGFLLVRSQGHGIGPGLSVLGAALALLALLTFLSARRKQLSPERTWFHLDIALAMRGALTGAAEGVGPWPPAKAIDGKLPAWKAASLTRPITVFAASLLVALFVPFAPRSSAQFVPAEKPQSWQQTEALVDRISRENLIEETAAEEIRRQLEALAALPPEEWFSQSGLEAGDALAGSTQRSLQQLEQDLRLARSLLDTARQTALTDPGAAEALEQLFEQTLRSLEQNPLPLDEEMLERLRQLAPSAMQALSDAEWEALSRQLRERNEALRDASGRSLEEALRSHQQRLQSELQLRRDRGTPTRGPGAAPLEIGENPPIATRERPETLPKSAAEGADPAESIAESQAPHEIDSNRWTGPLPQGGAARHDGGSRATWSERVTPNERTSLKAFFRNAPEVPAVSGAE